MKTKFLPVTKAVKYGASKTSSTVNTALNPYNLAEGAIGLYGIHNSATNPNKLCLIGDADTASEAAGLVPSDEFNGNELFFALGTAEGFIKSDSFQPNKIKYTAKHYVAGTKTVQDVGYTSNATAGLLNQPSTILRGDEAYIKAVNLADNSELDRTGATYSGYASVDSDSMYNILSELVEAVYADSQRVIDVDIHTDLTGSTPVANSATLTVVHGSTAVTTSADAAMDVGDYLEIDGDTYKVAAETTSTITLDRPYRGASATVANAACFDQGATAPTEVGLEITDKSVGVPVAIATGGLIESATKSTSTTYVAPVGTGTQIQAAEKRARTSFGNLDVTDRNVPLRDLLTDTSLNYDQYVITAYNERATSDPHTSNGNSQVYTECVIAFRTDVADTGGENQSDFEDVMGDLAVLFNFTAQASIIA